MIIEKDNGCLTLDFQLEGPDLVLYRKSVDPSKPRVWVEGTEYRFGTNLVSRQAIGSRKLQEIFGVL